MKIPEEMMPEYKVEKKYKTSVFVEFHVEDLHLIKELVDFLDAWQYPKFPEDVLHRREFGRIETPHVYIRFLGNSSKINE